MKDLSNVEHSMSNIIISNHDVLDNSTTVPELVQKLKDLFKINNLDTEASRRLIKNVAKQHSFVAGLQVVYNSYLCGCDLAVL